jgi:hypothetical protein
MVNIGTPDKDRASTHHEREQLLYDLMECWDRVGDLRLGQLLVNTLAARINKDGGLPDDRSVGNLLFYVEDRVLLGLIREFVRDHYPLAGESARSS